MSGPAPARSASSGRSAIRAAGRSRSSVIMTGPSGSPPTPLSSACRGSWSCTGLRRTRCMTCRGPTRSSSVAGRAAEVLDRLLVGPGARRPAGRARGDGGDRDDHHRPLAAAGRDHDPDRGRAPGADRLLPRLEAGPGRRAVERRQARRAGDRPLHRRGSGRGRPADRAGRVLDQLLAGLRVRRHLRRGRYPGPLPGRRDLDRQPGTSISTRSPSTWLRRIERGSTSPGSAPATRRSSPRWPSRPAGSTGPACRGTSPPACRRTRPRPH